RRGSGEGDGGGGGREGWDEHGRRRGQMVGPPLFISSEKSTLETSGQDSQHLHQLHQHHQPQRMGAQHGSRPMGHRHLDPRVAQLLVDRTVQLSQSYSPRQMAQMLQLLFLRLDCYSSAPAAAPAPAIITTHLSPDAGLAALQQILYGNAVYLERLAGRSAVQLRQQQQPQQQGRQIRRRLTSRRLRDAVRELGAAALESVKTLAAAGAGAGTGEETEAGGSRGRGWGRGRLGDEGAAALLPRRWWRVYLAVMEVAVGEEEE
ncbi:hypothetical protein Agub_g9502, partial [Astrephomene gubernaculifera]